MKPELLSSNIELENDQILLLPFEHERNIELKQIIFEPSIWKYMGISIKNEQNFEDYVKQTLNDKKKGLCYPFLIIDKKTNRAAGSTRYGHLNTSCEKCEIGWTWLGIEFQGMGVNKAVKYELLNFGFEKIGFRRIQFSADQENLRSQRAIEKLGAKREGLFRNNYIDSNGNSRNDVYFSIIKEEWAQLKTDKFREFQGAFSKNK